MYDYIFFTGVTSNVPVKPMGVYKIAHQLRSRGRRCLVVDHLCSWSETQLKILLTKSVGANTLALGFSTTFLVDTNSAPSKVSTDFLFSQGKDFEDRVISFVKDINPSIKIMMGGARSRSECSNRNVNFVVLGYGESAVLNIDDHLTKQVPLQHNYTNIWGIQIIDDRAASGFDFPHSEFVWLPEDVVNHRVLPLEIARGCIFNCKFCSYPLRAKKNLDFIRVQQSLEKELKHNWEQYQIQDYWLMDDTFNDNDAKLNIMLDVIKKLDFQPSFWAYVRLDLLTVRKHVDILYDVGLRAMFFGIETLNPKTAKLIGKGFDRERQIDTIRYIRDRYPDVNMQGSFIVGLPEESIDSVTETYERCRDQDIPLHSYKFNPLHIRKTTHSAWSSDIEKNWASYGYRDIGTSPDSTMINWANEHMDHSTAQSLVDAWFEESKKIGRLTVYPMQQQALINLGFSREQSRTMLARDLDSADVRDRQTVFSDAYKRDLLKQVLTANNKSTSII